MTVGIDLGTTFSLVSYLDPATGKPALVPDLVFQKDTTPSVVHLGARTALVGWQAEAKFDQAPQDTPLVSFFKRRFSDNGPIAYAPDGTPWHPEAIAALLLKKLRYDAIKHLGTNITGAVITVPAHFDNQQRNKILMAAQLIDLPVLALLQEPVAAALHYGIIDGHAPQTASSKAFFVYDLGGGTFDASVLAYHPVHGIDVQAKNGDTSLGGLEFDGILQDMIVEQLGSQLRDSFFAQRHIQTQLRRAAEEAKIAFSDPNKHFLKKNILLGEVFKEVTLARGIFDQRARAILERTVEISRKCLFESKLPLASIDAFLLVGGSALMPVVRQSLIEGLGLPPEKVLLHRPLQAVAFGAALRANQLSGTVAASALPTEFRDKVSYYAGFRSIDPLTGAARIETLLFKGKALNSVGYMKCHTRSDTQDHILLDLVQYFENPDEAVSLGRLVIGPIQNPALNYIVEVGLQYSPDGCLAVKATDLQTGAEIKHRFANSDQDARFFLQQKNLVSNVLVNMVGEDAR